MLQDKLREMEKNDHLTAVMASKARNRRHEWIKNTMDIIDSGVGRGGPTNIATVKKFAEGKF